MKKLALTIIAAALVAGCTTTQSSTAPGVGTNAPLTTVTTTTKGLDPAFVQQMDDAVTTLLSNAPSAIADAAAISALVHPETGTNK